MEYRVENTEKLRRNGRRGTYEKRVEHKRKIIIIIKDQMEMSRENTQSFTYPFH